MTSATPAAPSLRQRHVDRTRAALVAAALELFRERGFAATTVEEIAGRADVAPRTFFRYFPTKEAVLFHHIDDKAAILRERLRQRPPDEPANESILAVLAGLATEVASDPEHVALVGRLTREQPALVAEQRRTVVERFGDVLLAELSAREGLSVPTLALRTQVAILSTCMALVLQTWAEAGGEGSPLPFLEEAMRASAEASTGALAWLERAKAGAGEAGRGG